jgi:putative transposase
MAEVLGVSRSGYYAWLTRPESNRKKQQRALDTVVKVCFKASNDRSGSPKVCQALKQQGFGCSRTAVANSMRRQGLRAKTRRKFVFTTDSRHNLLVAPNLLNRKFDVDRPNTVWVSDITYLWSRAGWLYLTVFIDLFSRRVVGWSLSKDLGHESVLTALQRAIYNRRPGPGLMIHSDQGTQYCCEGFRKAIKTNQFVQSMSRKGNCWDNAVAESFFRALKTEWAYHINLIDIHHAKHELFEYIEVFYNNQRLHGTLNYLSPTHFESKQIA